MEGKNQIVNEIRTKIESFLLEMTVIKEKLPVNQRLMSSKWQHPDRRSVKVNFDAAFRQHLKQSSSGVVIRNNMGLVMGSGVVFHRHVADAFAAEALACLNAITFARDMGFMKVVVEGDSRTIIVKGQKRDRVSNLVTHTIASMGFKLGNSQFWVEEVPSDAIAVTERDRQLMQQHDQDGSIIA
ncbi:hypothetical protein Goari_005924 [Gossypium aridum]|uniref:RNase H type-1 domain-containing protein n=1 Tax=Gossypium aridum TaxID=34290 RepID=A0A7J8XLE7_GOSAI|nr:hypothetical protein [Gossypium aridum]